MLAPSPLRAPTKLSTLLILTLVLAALIACGGISNVLDKDTGEGADAVASAQLAMTESALLVAGLGTVDPSKTPEQIAQDVGAAAQAAFTPAACANIGAAGPVVTYVLNGCSGPFGLTGLKGTFGITYSSSGSSISAHMVATDLEANGAKMTMDVTTLYTPTDGEKTRITTNGVGVAADGSIIARTGSYDVSWTSASSCIQLDGNWESTIDGKSVWGTSANAFSRCGNTCPDGQLTHAGIGVDGNDSTGVSVSFDGTDTAIVYVVGVPKVLALSCVPVP